MPTHPLDGLTEELVADFEDTRKNLKMDNPTGMQISRMQDLLLDNASLLIACMKTALKTKLELDAMIKGREDG